MTKDVKTLCPYCGVGCGLIATTDGVTVLRVRGDPHHPANLGRVCPKGGASAQTINVSSRLRYAMLRDEALARPQIVPSAAAVRQAAEGLRRILQSDGPGAIAFYLSGQLTTEAQYIANKFGKAYLRTNHVDSNSRLCMASAAAGMSLSLGSDGPPGCYADIELCDVFLFIGSNAADCHPVTYERVKKRLGKGAKSIVVDPRRTLTAEDADIHLAVRPGTDLVLVNGFLRLLRDWDRLNNQYIADHTEGWDELNALLDEYARARVAAECGIAQEDFLKAARFLADRPHHMTLWTMGVNQSLEGTFTNNAIINLHLATGRIGRPGMGPFSLTGQPNAMGGRDVGYSSHGLPGYRFIVEPEHRRQMESLWGLQPGAIHPEPGYDAVRMFDAIDRGEIKAIWIIGSNPAASMPNLPKIRRALAKAELMFQDAYHPTETSPYAHVLLPAAVNFEQEGTFCNSERRVTLMEQAVPPPGDAKPDWWWVREVAKAMGFERGMSFNSAAAIFDEFARTTTGRPNDQSALYHDMLRARGPQQWPNPALGRSIRRRYLDGQFPRPSGKAKFWARREIPRQERPDAEFPLVMTTGRTLNQWHTRTKTGTVEQLNLQDPAPYLQMHPQDAAALLLTDGQEVEICSRRGRAVSSLRIDEAISPGTVFMPIHWNELWSPGASPNEAASDATDSISKEPALKYCAVVVRSVVNSANAVAKPQAAEVAVQKVDAEDSGEASEHATVGARVAEPLEPVAGAV